MVSSSQNRKLIFDEIRKSWVKATPEEEVRQQWIQRMTQQLGYPKELLVIEKALGELPHLHSTQVPNRRLDILCYGKESSLFPLLLMECKEAPLTEDALNQVIGYNHFVKAAFVATANLTQVQVGFFDQAKNQYIFCHFLPSYKELIQWVKR